MSTLKDAIKDPNRRMFRRLFIKRRQGSDGLFETDFQEITDDVLKWSSIVRKADIIRSAKFKFNNMSVKLSNKDGKYSHEDNSNSIWSGFANQQRTLVRIEAGFYDFTTTGGVVRSFANTQSNSIFDSGVFGGAIWDDQDDTIVAFTGIISGDIPLNRDDTVTIPIKPLSQVFLDYSAQNVTGYTSTGMTASQFVELVRDQTSGGQFIFRPFFGDTTTNWNIQSTTAIYGQLNTSTAKDVRDKTVWDVITKLAEAEQFIAYVGKNGVFNFVDQALQTATVYELYGAGPINTEFGHTIKNIDKFETKITNYYSRVRVQFEQPDTATSFVIQQATLSIDATSASWNLGERALEFSNFWLNTATANDVALKIFNEVSGFKKELRLTTSFIPQLDLLNKVRVSYDPVPPQNESMWDLNDWDTELTWDGVGVQGTPFSFSRKEFKILEVKQNLDKLETSLLLRET